MELRFQQHKNKLIIAWISALLIILNSGYYWSTATDSYLPLALLALWTVYLLISERRPVNMKDPCVLLLLIGIFLSIAANFNIQNILSGGRVACTFVCVYILSQYIRMEDFVSCYAGLIKAEIVIAILFNLLLRVTSLSFLPQISSSTVTYVHAGIVAQTIGGSRLVGVFWEPGVFASSIILAAIGEIYYSKKPIPVRSVVLYIIGVYFTYSTAGLLIMALVLVGHLLHRNRLDENAFVVVCFFGVVVVGIVYYNVVFEWLAETFPAVFSKLTETNSGTTATRLTSPLINLELFFDRPLFGWGFTGAATQYLTYKTVKINAQTSTSTQILSAIGICGIAYTLLNVAPIFSKKKLGHLYLIGKVIVAVSLLLIVNKEPHAFMAVSWIYLFYFNQTQESNALDDK